MLFLSEEFQAAWKGKDPWEIVPGIEGEVFREIATRRTVKFSLGKESYFLKYHRGTGWNEIFKNLFQFRLPVVSASNEWEAIRRLQEIGVPTMTIAAYGKKGLNPATTRSFIITRDLGNTISLEDLCKSWPEKRPSFRLKCALLKKIAEISQTMHKNGVCHRDYYICHFLLHAPVDHYAEHETPKLSLIDLHRALYRRNLGNRWIEKDIAGLYFSSMDIGLTKTDIFRFIRHYKSIPLRDTLKQDVSFWRQVNHKANRLYNKINRLQ